MNQYKPSELGIPNVQTKSDGPFFGVRGMNWLQLLPKTDLNSASQETLGRDRQDYSKYESTTADATLKVAQVYLCLWHYLCKSESVGRSIATQPHCRDHLDLLNWKHWWVYSYDFWAEKPSKVFAGKHTTVIVSLEIFLAPSLPSRNYCPRLCCTAGRNDAKMKFVLVQQNLERSNADPSGVKGEDVPLVINVNMLNIHACIRCRIYTILWKFM